jgi:hypothetical protein
MSESFTLRVRGEEIGRAVGLENWQRAASFVCDRFGRTATTPRWAFDVPMWPGPPHDAYPPASMDSFAEVRDHWAGYPDRLSEQPWRPSDGR